mgnify:CR=1 FL=1
MNLLAVDPAEFTRQAKAWIQVGIDLSPQVIMFLGAIAGIVAYVNGLLNKARIAAHDARLNRQGDTIKTLGLAMPPIGIAPSASQETTALQENTAATQANTDAQNALNPLTK